jgi:type 1 fimbriae regulatory protein FimB
MIDQIEAPIRKKYYPRRERSRKHLTPGEVGQLLAAAKKKSRNSERDHCLLLLMFQHGLRVTESCKLKLSDVNLSERIIHRPRRSFNSSIGVV